MIPLKLSDPHQRSKGLARAEFFAQGGRAVLGDLYQQGSAKLIVLPGPELVFLNTSGGLTGGDRLGLNITLGAQCRLTATTQTAERAYRSTSGAAHVDIAMTVGDGAHLDWLPQETILFDAAQLRRRTIITLGVGASCLMAETVVLGRAAMGEHVTALDFHDWRLIRHGDTPCHAEALALDAPRLNSRAAGLAGMRAFATLVLVADGAQDKLALARAALHPDPDVNAAASAMPGRLVVRLMARDNWPLRKQMVRLLHALRPSPLPRVWQM
ncbi:urease accessory protein UreD [Roseinatronobacter sp. S2]|uniref:urease accessory protein UreD n=1 Tax=Roseinatronobacter sp. S2 TaxID=3035471 RepID=UPI00240EE411|nr:urease accessory protein UreD [Roseinatronobacter sp. S2]WFE74101.1 urease accessory protein UreD [Roseinatronobacter sp. S2]